MGAADEVLAAARRRAAALSAHDADGLRALLHPSFRWTTHRGEVFGRDHYVEANTSAPLWWLDQRLAEVSVTVVGDAAVLTCVVDDVVDDGSGPETFRMPVTQTWVRIDAARWLCLAGHAGPRLPGTAPATGGP